MSRLRLSFLFALAVLFGAHSALATTFAAGSCRPGLTSFPTISAAVAAVPAGSTVLVCPGTYAEQVNITTPLTLQGISSGDADQAVVTVPGGGLAVNVTSIFGQSFAAQVLVNTGGTGAVNIANITVDGTGNGLGGSASLAGIFYQSLSSGVVNHVTTRNQIDSGLGYGILAENGTSTPESVTIENSSVHDFDIFGILTETNQSPSTLTATIKANHVNSSAITTFVFGIAIVSAGSVTGNVLAGATGVFAQAITTETYPVTVSGNTTTNWGGFGIVDFVGTGATYTSNSISDSSVGGGIALEFSGAVVQRNTITQSFTGIDFLCNTATVSGNTVNDATIGLNDVPSSFSMTNTFNNVGTIRNHGFCTTALSNSSLSKGAKPRPPVPLPNTQ